MRPLNARGRAFTLGGGKRVPGVMAMEERRRSEKQTTCGFARRARAHRRVWLAGIRIFQIAATAGPSYPCYQTD